MMDMKMADQFAGHEIQIAGHENGGPKMMAGVKLQENK